MIKSSLELTRVSVSLFLLRVGAFIGLLMWTLDKFINPGHAAAVFSKFYFIDGLSSGLAYLIGTLQLVIIVAFLLGVKKRLSYGLVLAMHLVSTIASYERYLDPWTSPHLLFFAAWPMLASIVALYLMREKDTLLTVRR